MATAAQWALWNRFTELDRSSGIYKKLLKTSTELAKSEGYEGARWPKCIGPDLREWPFIIHSTLIWQQPHPIFFAELDYRAHPTKATLEKWLPVVDATADFISSYAFWDTKTNRYVPWAAPCMWLLRIRIRWLPRIRPMNSVIGDSACEPHWSGGSGLVLSAKPGWSKVLNGLSPLPQEDGKILVVRGREGYVDEDEFRAPPRSPLLYGLLPGGRGR